MENNFSIFYEGKQHSGKYEKIAEAGETRIHVLCPSLTECIPQGFYFVLRGVEYKYNPALQGKTKEIATLILTEILRKED